MPPELPLSTAEPAAAAPKKGHGAGTARALRWTLVIPVGVLAVMVVAWSVGLIAFVHAIRGETVSDRNSIAPVDAIVVLTGGRGRLSAAFDLLGAGTGQALFITGVHADVGIKDLADVNEINQGLASCCVVLGHQARDTAGNASETALWAAEKGVGSILLVTSRYHVPRSMVEFRSAMPDTRLHPYPVDSPDVHLDDWWRWPGTSSLVIAEYNKFLYATLRSFFHRRSW